jgi:rhamnogalacturonyl hydrolase YesR
MGSYAGWVKGTRWQLTEDQQAFWADMLLNGMQWMVYKGYTAHNIVGRHDAEKGSLRADISGLADKFLRAADIQLPGYAAVLAMRNDLRDGRCLSDSVKYFWDADVILVHSPRYFASIRMLSDRVVGTESSEGGMAQGLNNFYMADGSCLLYRNGTEYDAARLGWNWRCIPGATVKQKSGPLPLVPWSHGYESNNRISGGVSDGRVSIGAFYLDRANPYAKTKAVKAYFTFPDMLLCMGNSVSDDDTARGDIYTTLNQTTRKTAIYYSVNGGVEQVIPLRDSAQREFRITSPSWYWQDSTGYIILPAEGAATLALLQAGERRGNWQDMDKRNPDLTDAVNIFQLCINHGSAASGWNDRSYRYVVVPSVSREALAAFFKSRVLQKGAGSLYINDNNERVVSATYKGYTGVVFMGEKGGSATGLGPDGLAVSADKPAVLLLKREDSGMDIHVSDAKVNFEPGNWVGIHINRTFAPASALPPHAERAWKLEAAAPGADGNGHSFLSVDLSKTDPVYTGEPVDIPGVYRYGFYHTGLSSAGSTHDTGLPSARSTDDTGLPSAGSTLNLMKNVADWQLNTWSRDGMQYPGYNWVNAVFYTGLFALAHTSGEQKYYDALRAVGDSLDWKTGPRKAMADDYCIGQTYTQLYGMYREPGMIAGFRSQADSICARPHTGSLEWKNNIHLREWAWCDALFMGPPALAYLSSVTGDRKYLDEADHLWWKTTDYLFDKKEDLYFRDSRYFGQQEANGAKMFWSRGNGWVMGGLVRMLSNMPDGYAGRPRFIRLYHEMAKKIAALQDPDGTWHTSLLDPGSYPNKETSGTALYCYALAWGINHGLLRRERYLPSVRKSWQALESAVHKDGELGFVQQVGDKPGSADENSSEAYGPGAFLLAGSEMLKLETK